MLSILLLDPAGAFRTFQDVLKVGRACDGARYMWYEDPFRAAGSRASPASAAGADRTPMLMGEHVRGLEAKADTIHSGATDFVRANASADGGITGVMKIAALAEAFGLGVELHGGGSGTPKHHVEPAQRQLLRAGLRRRRRRRPSMTRTLLPAIEQRVDREPRPEQQWLGGLAAGRLGTPEDVKGMAIFLAADASSWVPAG